MKHTKQKDKEEKMNDEDMLSDEEFFFDGDDNKKGKMPSGSRRTCVRGRGRNLFSSVKTRMVMRAYGVSRAMALKIIADCDKRRKGAFAI